MQNADLVVAIGSRFDDRCTGKLVGFAPKAKIIAHIDIDPTSISKNVFTHIPVVGDVNNVLTELVKLVHPAKHADWLKQIEKWRKDNPLTYKQDNRLRPQYVIEEICRLTGGDAIVCTEVGQHQMWSAQYYHPNKPRHFITSGGLGTMGYGFPASIGVKLANPKKTVIDIAGDGSFQMNIQELATASLNNVNVIVCILNNSYLGMVRQWQHMFYNHRYSSVNLCTQPHKQGECAVPDFVKVAEAYNAIGLRVTKKEDVDVTLKKAFKIKDKPVVIDFVVEQEEDVLPMVPTGATLDEIITNSLA
jgi:acetolactate synthase-1/2/3 large subunit